MKKTVIYSAFLATLVTANAWAWPGDDQHAFTGGAAMISTVLALKPVGAVPALAALACVGVTVVFRDESMSSSGNYVIGFGQVAQSYEKIYEALEAIVSPPAAFTNDLFLTTSAGTSFVSKKISDALSARNRAFVAHLAEEAGPFLAGAEVGAVLGEFIASAQKLNPRLSAEDVARAVLALDAGASCDISQQ